MRLLVGLGLLVQVLHDFMNSWGYGTARKSMGLSRFRERMFWQIEGSEP